MAIHGEYKVPGGKLVVVDFEQEAGVIKNFQLSGDFFLEPETLIDDINNAVNGLDIGSTILDIAESIEQELPEHCEMLGVTPSSVGVAIRRALTNAATWHDYDWEIVHEEEIDPMLNAALDEVLTKKVGSGERKPTLRIWESDRPAVFIGSFQSVKNEIDSEAVEKLGVDVVRRISGGGAMYMVPENCITYSLYVPESLVRGMSFADSYAFLDEWVLEALNSVGIDASYAPLNDIVGPSGKIGGAAQKRLGSGAILHHVTIAYDMNSDEMLQVLRIGREKLSDKGIPSANKRVDPLKTQTQLSREELIQRMVEVFKQRHGGVEGSITDTEWDEAEELLESKFDTPAWRNRIK